MFDYNITIFNYSYKENRYYPKLIHNVELQPTYKTIPEVDMTTNETSVLIIVPSFIDNKELYIDFNDNKFIYSSPKSWDNSDDKTSIITFQSNTDFVINGDHTSLQNIDLNELKNTYDNVFIINEVKNYTELGISHFELICN